MGDFLSLLSEDGKDRPRWSALTAIGANAECSHIIRLYIMRGT
ncbi:hypothetical protein [Pseudomonas panipatensis]|nr:hypothetical protein [Pseudomonas panipatensis]